MRILGINAVFHDPAAALVVDGRIVAAAEEERFNRRKHGKICVPFTTWELPELAAAWCLSEGGVAPDELDAIAYSYDPRLAPPASAHLADDDYEGLRTYYVERAPSFLASALPGFDPAKTRFVAHHVAHAASAYLGGPYRDCAVLVLDGRGERTSALAGVVRDGNLSVLATQALPHSLGLRYEELTMHLGFRRSSDEYKVMALASYGTPVYLERLRAKMAALPNGGFFAPPFDYAEFCPPREAGAEFAPEHADLAASVQARLEEVLIDCATWLQLQTGDRHLVMAGGVALNCVANARLLREGPFDDVWVQPAAGDAGTALGAALYAAHELGDTVEPMRTAALGRGFDDAQLRRLLTDARVPFSEPADVAETVGEILANDGIVAWFQGRSEFGPRALGQRSFLAHPGHAANLERLNDVKGREQFRPVAPMVLLDRAAEIFEGRIPSEYMLFTHRVRDGWRDRLPAVTHVDGSARVQTVADGDHPLLAKTLRAFERRSGLPVVVNTSLNTAGRPMVDDVRDALECFGSSPIDAMAIGKFVVARDAARAGA